MGFLDPILKLFGMGGSEEESAPEGGAEETVAPEGDASAASPAPEAAPEEPATPTPEEGGEKKDDSQVSGV